MHQDRSQGLAQALGVALAGALALVACSPAGPTCPACDVDAAVGSAAVDAPVLLGTDPPSPGTSLRITLSVAAQASTSTWLFDVAGCVGAPVGVRAVSAAGRVSFPYAVRPLSRTVFSALSVGPVGQRSPCSAPLAYQHVELPPPPVTEPPAGAPSLPDNTGAEPPVNPGEVPAPPPEEPLTPGSGAPDTAGAPDGGSPPTETGGSDDDGADDDGWDPLLDDPSTGDTGTGDTGTGDTGTGDTGTGDSGTGDTGTGDSGTGDTGTGDSGA